MPLTLCQACDTLLAHHGKDPVRAAQDHALDRHLDALCADPGSLAFTHLAESPRPLIGAPT